MAVNKKGSRKIVVDEHEFRWRATGNDGWITVVIWSSENSDCRVVGTTNYHHDWKKVDEERWSSNSQAIVTNRVVREVILHVGTKEILEGRGQINIGEIEQVFDFDNAVRN
ncbi:hypothetical protein FLL45_22655 [Aliikangiella marina]|uniref:Uncharacterized protein n=1 Tax=Aliikangiella marina TaxID=1712262 RepID=A0A545T1Q5_9GAMM|nr:hypothetical protein [Aliikangiella marina]TQV71129.1 hypothetical protein FLL45_22655 [Aliikangiella marina]